jgi:hypothetical protein
MHILLNSSEALKILSSNYNLPIVHSFHDLVDAYENKLIKMYPYDQVLDIAINYDNTRLLKKCLNNIEVPDKSAYEFSDEEEEFVNEYYAIMLSAAQKCIQQKSYNCLREIGPYLIFAIAVEMTLKGDDFDNGEYITNLLTIAVDHHDYAAIDIVLSWNKDLIKPVDVDLNLEDILEKTVDISDTVMYDYINKKRNQNEHNSLRMILKAILNKNPEMIRKVIDTYDKTDFLIMQGAYQQLFDAAQELDFETKQYVEKFLSNLELRGHKIPYRIM